MHRHVIVASLAAWILAGCGASNTTGQPTGKPAPADDHRPAPGAVAQPLPDRCKTPPSPNDRAIKKWLDAGCYRHPTLGWSKDAHEARKAGPTRPVAPHGRMTVYYSPEVVAWLEADRPPHGIEPGGMMVKEMFDWETGETKTGRAVMLMTDRQETSFSGWYWYPQNRYVGPGCIGCHASAERDQTFADIRHITGEPKHTVAAVEGIELAGLLDDHPPIAHELDAAEPPLMMTTMMAFAGDGGAASSSFAERFPWTGAHPDPAELALPSWREGYEYPAGAEPDTFLTSNNCVGCHSSGPPNPGLNMSVPNPDVEGGRLNLSPFAEWGASMMGLAGRDPVFHAQLESEKALRPEWTEWLEDTCFRCHGVAGQRQLHLDAAADGTDRKFKASMIYAEAGEPDGKYGALARDGITCVACHAMSDQDLGEPSTFTGQFHTGPPGEVYGPRSEHLRDKPMFNAIGVTPKPAPHVSSSELCASCHSVVLPVVDAGAAFPGADGVGRLPTVHEQATYREWRNSAFHGEESCQDCHMPTTYEGEELSFKLANIEGWLPHVSMSCGPEELALLERKKYRRHTLLGINLFVMEMFQQFSGLLGIPRHAPWKETKARNGDTFASSLAVAQEASLDMARSQTATVELSKAPTHRRGKLEAKVRVTNLVGHKFPSGVGFRRAFLMLEVLDSEGGVLWASGATDAQGVIVDGDGKALVSEMTRDPRDVQPHHRVISRADQVQIYEEKVADDQGRLTTSFLGMHDIVKDTRLLPRGWSRKARDMRDIQPHGLNHAKVYPKGEHFDEVAYRIPTAGFASPPAAVRAALFYQSIPPSYLAERFRTAQGRETARLYYLASQLDTADEGSPIRDWKLEVASSGRVAVE